MASLSDYGWTDERELQFKPLLAAGRRRARVVIEHRADFVLRTESGEERAPLAAALHLRAREEEGEKPVVGDWVALAGDPDEAEISELLPRHSKLSRLRPGEGSSESEQLLVANADRALLVTDPLDFSARRLERYLAMAAEGGVPAAVVLTKVDLYPDISQHLVEIAAVARSISVHPISNVSGEGLLELGCYFQPGRTVALVGSSGVGKSSLVNALLRDEHLETQPTANDGRGRHTTSQRELLLLPSGGLAVDTPGIRELGLWEGDTLEDVFAEISDLEALCRFSDCQHAREPGCAVGAAVRSGSLAAARFESYRKLQGERRPVRRHGQRGRRSSGSR